MKELLTKKFWQDVKKTFDEARDETTGNSGDSQAVTPGEPADRPPQPEAIRPKD
jgi:hypothetical protein